MAALCESSGFPLAPPFCPRAFLLFSFSLLPCQFQLNGRRSTNPFLGRLHRTFTAFSLRPLSLFPSLDFSADFPSATDSPPSRSLTFHRSSLRAVTLVNEHNSYERRCNFWTFVQNLWRERERKERLEQKLVRQRLKATVESPCSSRHVRFSLKQCAFIIFTVISTLKSVSTMGFVTCPIFVKRRRIC